MSQTNQPLMPLNATAEQRLTHYAASALRNNRKSWDGARDEFFRFVKVDAEALWVMFAQYRAEAAQRLLSQAGEAIHQKQVFSSLRVVAGDRTIPTSDSDRHRHRAAAIAAAGNVARLSILDTFKIGRKSIGDSTPRQARKWAAERKSDVHWIHLLTENLPPDEPIRKYRDAAIATQLRERANVEHLDTVQGPESEFG